MISVIIPAYQAEASIDRCLTSLQAQDHDRFEVIIVDDGSTDSTETICRKYVNTDSRFHYLLTSNCGVSHARNVGLEASKGDYICFVDADDYVEPDYLSTLYNAMVKNQPPLVFCGWYLNEAPIILIEDQCKMCGLEVFEYLLTAQYSNSFAVWNKMFLRTQIGDLRFDEELHYMEDGVFIIDYLMKRPELYVISQPLYHYQNTPNSLTHHLKLDERRLSGLSSRMRIIEKMEEISPRLVHLAKARYFEEACLILFGSYRYGERKKAHEIGMRSFRYGLDYFLYLPNRFIKKIKYLIMFLIVRFDLGMFTCFRCR